MKRTSHIRDGMFVEAYIVPNTNIMREAYGELPCHTCGECRYRALMVENYTCAKLDREARIPALADGKACGKFEAKP